MDKELLKWGIEHSDPEKLKSGDTGFDPKSIDPELVDFLLNGRKDGVKAVGIKECAQNIKEREDVDEKLAAFEHLHMLVEEIDHAIGMENLGLWPDVISVARTEDANEELRMWALWTMAAAAHHNPKAQEALLKHGSLDLALGILESKQPYALRQKAVLLVSSLVKQNTTCFLEFVKIKGLSRLETLFVGFSEDEMNLRDRLAFFLDQLFQERPRLRIEHASLYALVSQHKEASQ